MSDTSTTPSPSGPASPQAPRPAETAAFPAIDIFSLRANISAVLVCVILTFGGVKLSQFLPDQLYFSFARSADAGNTPFLIQPAHISREEMCEVLDASDKLKYLKCDQPADVEEAEEPAGLSAEERERREAAAQKEYDRQVAAEEKIARELVNQRVQQGGYLMEIGAALIRLAIPFVAGFLVGRLFGSEGPSAAGIGGALAALLFCWPVIILWERVVTPEWQMLYSKFMALYIFYIALFYFVARLGAMVGARLAPGRWSVPINFQKITESVIGAVVTGIGVKIIERVILS